MSFEAQHKTLQFSSVTWRYIVLHLRHVWLLYHHQDVYRRRVDYSIIWNATPGLQKRQAWCISQLLDEDVKWWPAFNPFCTQAWGGGGNDWECMIFLTANHHKRSLIQCDVWVSHPHTAAIQSVVWCGEVEFAIKGPPKCSNVWLHYMPVNNRMLPFTW